MDGISADLGLDQTLVSDKWLTEAYEYEQGGQLPNIFDNLKSAETFWEKDLQAPSEIMSIIKNGYEIPFISPPPKYEKRNNKSAISNESFVTEAVLELLSANLIEEVSSKPDIISPLSVAEGEKLRLILDLSATNDYVKSVPFVLEDQNTFLEMARDCKYVAKFDIKSCYHQIPMHKNSRKYLGFKWTINGVIRYFQFKVLPFGLTTGPYICKKLFKPLVNKWRTEGIKLVLFFDDGALCHKSFQICNDHSQTVKNDLLKAHILPNMQKSEWNPKTSCTWLGFFWNFENATVSLSSERVIKLFNKLYQFKKNPCMTTKVVASIVGSVVSMKLILGDRAVFLTRFLQTLVNYREEMNFPWTKIVDFSILKQFPQADAEVSFLLENFEKLDVKNFTSESLSTEHIIFGDASDVKAGGYLKMGQKNYPFSVNLPEHQISKSSTSREIFCLKLALEIFQSTIKGSKVLYITDSKCTETIMAKGSTKIELHLLAVDIFKFCDFNHISLAVGWVPRSHNAIADFYSKIEDYDDWSVTKAFFDKVTTLSGLEFSLDCFASRENSKCRKFYSRFSDQGSSGVDSLKFPWSGEVVWAVPPPRLAVKVLWHFKWSKCRGVLIVPKWTGQAYWALLKSDFSHYIQSNYEFPGGRFILPGKSGNYVFKDFKGILAVFVIDCTIDL